MIDHVHIIESPSATDLLESRTEGYSLSSILDLHMIDNDYSLVVDKECLKACARRIAERIEKEEYRPYLHFSCHGDADGIQLTSEEELSWAKLKEIFSPVFEAAASEIVLCFSSCFGLNSHKMHSIINNDFKFSVGPNEAVDWDESLVAYSSFYHNLIRKSSEFSHAVIAMNAAIGLGRAKFMGIKGDQLTHIKLDAINTVLKDAMKHLNQIGKKPNK